MEWMGGWNASGARSAPALWGLAMVVELGQRRAFGVRSVGVAMKIEALNFIAGQIVSGLPV
jgi:hypothetical protein